MLYLYQLSTCKMRLFKKEIFMNNNSANKILILFLAAVFSLSGCKSSETGILSSERAKEITEEKENTIPLIVTAEEGCRAYYRGDLETSADIFREILKKQPENREAELSLLYILYEMGKYREAPEYTRPAVRQKGKRNSLILTISAYIYYSGNEKHSPYPWFQELYLKILCFLFFFPAIRKNILPRLNAVTENRKQNIKEADSSIKERRPGKQEQQFREVQRADKRTLC